MGEVRTVEDCLNMQQSPLQVRDLSLTAETPSHIYQAEADVAAAANKNLVRAHSANLDLSNTVTSETTTAHAYAWPASTGPHIVSLSSLVGCTQN